ncbi:MAG: phosphoribosyltransferase [Candidatus Bathyarchaeia archaeon]
MKHREDLNIFDEPQLRFKRHVFKDRDHAGKLLAEKLRAYRGLDVIVLAIPSGGVPVGYAVAKGLDAPLDLMTVRKIQIPFNPEAGFGAVTVDGTAILNEPLVRHLNLSPEQVEIQISKAMRAIERRHRRFCGERPPPRLEGRTAIIVDDGVASGYTMLAAVASARKLNPAKIVVAVPTAPVDSLRGVAPRVDELYCLNVRDGFYFAVADAYLKWYDLGDEEVLAYLDKARAIREK